MSSSSAACSAIELDQVPDTRYANGLVINTSSPASRSTVFSDKTLVESPLSEKPPCSGLQALQQPVTEDVSSILQEDCAKGLQWVPPRKNSRWDQTVGRQAHLYGSNCDDPNPTISDSSSVPCSSISPTSSLTSKRLPRRLSSGRFKSTDDMLLGYGPTNGWVKFITPDGKPFFTSKDVDVVFITDTFIRRPELLTDIEHWMKLLRRIICAQKRTQECPNQWEVYLRVDEIGGICSYYMIDHERRQVFWAHEVDPYDLNIDDRVPDSAIELLLEAEFWAHLELFPHTVPSDAEEKLRGMLVYSHIDSATAPGSTSMYSPEECSLFLKGLECFSSSRIDAVVKNHLIARITKAFIHNRYLNFYGEEGARLDRSQMSNAPQDETVSIVIQCCLFILRMTTFGMDACQLEKIKNVLVDDVILPRLWKAFLADFVRGIEQSNIVAAIIFAANIGFLSINPLTKLQNFSSLVSTLFSMSSLLVGLHHARQHNSLLGTDAYTAAFYLQNSYYPSWGGYRLLAFFHCLPFALLIWSILTFSTTVGLLACQSPISVGSIVFLVAAVVQVVLLLVVVWFFWRIWEQPSGRVGLWWMEALFSSREPSGDSMEEFATQELPLPAESMV